MPSQFRDRRAQYYGVDPVPALSLRRFRQSEQESAGVFATVTGHPAGFSIPSHSHDLHSFYFVLDGSLSEHGAGGAFDVEATGLVFTPAGHIHRNSFHRKGGRCFLVELDGGWLSRLDGTGIRLDAPLVAPPGEMSRLALKLYREFRHADRVSPLLVEGLTLEIMGGFARHTARTTTAVPPWLHAVRELLHDRFADRIMVTELAAAAGVHPLLLTRAFRKHYRCSPAEYQRQLRVGFASRQLLSTRASLAEIAQRAGFSDQAHFTRTFREHTGYTPARFRSTFGA